MESVSQSRPHSPRPKSKPKFCPEKEFFSGLRGKSVVLGLANSEEAAEGLLLWVAQYTVCLGLKNGRKKLYYKHAIESVELKPA